MQHKYLIIVKVRQRDGETYTNALSQTKHELLNKYK